MSQIPQDDDKLVAFLRQHRPVPPTAKTNMETQLMELVDRSSLSRDRHCPLFWMISGLVTSSLLLVFASYRALNSSPQIANNSAELETFLIEGWNGVLEPRNVTSSTPTLESDWSVLADPQVSYAVSRY